MDRMTTDHPGGERPDPELAVCWGCSMLPITVWLPVRVLPAPPRTPTLTEISRALTNSPRLRGGVGPAYILSARKKGRFRGSSGPSVSGVQKTVSPEPEKERPETRFACDRDRFARARRNSFVRPSTPTL
jgi:hypothetical protein